jgi:hypothetical protein
MNESILDVLTPLLESKTQETKAVAKQIASAFGGKVHSSKKGWGTDISGIAKNKASQLRSFLKKEGFKDVSTKSTYKQLITHLGDNAWVFNKGDVTVRIADVDEIMVGGSMVKQRSLVVSVLYA